MCILLNMKYIIIIYRVINIKTMELQFIKDNV